MLSQLHDIYQTNAAFQKRIEQEEKTKTKSINGSRRASMNIFSHVGIIAHLSNEITFQVFQKKSN